MLLDATHLSKAIGAKFLFKDLSFSILPGEKIALIGRNGYGKTTLLRILSGEDHDFDGEVTSRKGIKITLTKQEHIHDAQQSPLEYVLHSVPDFYAYQKVLDEYEQGINTNINQYLSVLEEFTDRKYFNIIDSILNILSAFGIPNQAAHQPLANLSGGEKRYVEMTRMMFSRADLLLIDEPTNHMDYLGKERFITWMRSLPQSVVVVTHDRDVLKHVHKILELKDQRITVFKGSYDAYIAQNATNTLSSVKLYTDQLNRLKDAKKKVEWGLQMRAKSKEWKIRYDHWLRDYEKIKAETVKPAFWIDQDSVDALDKKVVDSYHKFKEKNIKINVSSESKRAGELVRVRNLSLGYDQPLFSQINLTVRNNDRLFIKGTNGAGKSTLVKTIMALSSSLTPKATVFDGEIKLGNDLRIGEYQQEISQTYLHMALEEAIRSCYRDKEIAVDDRQVKSMMAQYLFNPVLDGQQKIMHLSGGQKARFQLIKMFIGDPNLLILDEPTNHLDLPSIEELENALDKFSGGIIYISHDTYFIDRMGGDIVEL